MASPTTAEWLESLYEPAILLSQAAYHFFVVALKSIFNGEFFAPISRLRDDSFSRFWLSFAAARDTDPTTEPEQQAETLTGSSALIPPVLARSTGVVLDIGPGAGSQLSFFPNTSAITTIYGAEPSQKLHEQLQSRIEATGWAGKYRIVHCSAEKESIVAEMEKVGLMKKGGAEKDGGVFDSIVCTRVLCSVPKPEETVRGLYQLLKPGGKMLICEHVMNPWWTRKGSMIARGLQLVYSLLGWSFFMGDCSMNRDTGKILKDVASEDGGWENVELDSHFGWSPMSYVSGMLVKKNV